MPKEEVINELESWVEKNRPDEEIAYGQFESIHASGQENIAIYIAEENLVIQENDYKNPDSENHRECSYKAHDEDVF